MQGLPVLAHDASTHARGLDVRPRQAPLYLASSGTAGIAFGPGEGLGTWDNLTYAAQYPACVCPCERFGHALTSMSTSLGVTVGG
jgi:hypothetical protein